MKKAIILLLFCSFLVSCSSKITSIADGNELLEAGPFSFRYPEDWKFVAKSDNTNPALVKSFYTFTHPKNAHCRIAIEMIKFPFGEKATSSHVKSLLADKVRSLKKSFTEEGFGNFSVNSSLEKLGKERAKKLTLSAVNAGIVRDLVVYTLQKRNFLFFVSYQWHHNWDVQAQKRLLKAMHTFRLK